MPPGKPQESEIGPEELKYLKEDLEDMHHYLEEFSAFLPLPVLSVNPLGFVLDTNRALEVLAGSKKTEILGGPVERFFLEKEKLAGLQQKVLQGQSTSGEEITLLAKKKRVPISIYLAPRKDTEGNVIGYFVGIYDITEFKKLQESLEEKVRERTQELQKRVGELEKFHKITVGRELKMIELKKALREAREKINGKRSAKDNKSK